MPTVLNTRASGRTSRAWNDIFAISEDDLKAFEQDALVGSVRLELGADFTLEALPTVVMRSHRNEDGTKEKVRVELTPRDQISTFVRSKVASLFADYKLTGVTSDDSFVFSLEEKPEESDEEKAEAEDEAIIEEVDAEDADD